MRVDVTKTTQGKQPARRAWCRRDPTRNATMRVSRVAFASNRPSHFETARRTRRTTTKTIQGTTCRLVFEAARKENRRTGSVRLHRRLVHHRRKNVPGIERDFAAWKTCQLVADDAYDLGKHGTNAR